MSSRNAALDVAHPLDGATSVDSPLHGDSPVVLKGGKAGLEIVVDGDAGLEGIAGSLAAHLEEAPSFFAGSQARVRVVGKLPAGALGRLEEVAARFQLSIVEIGPYVPKLAEPAQARQATDAVPAPERDLADGSAPVSDDEEVDEDAPTEDVRVARRLAYEAVDEMGPGARLFVGPVRSGAVLEARGHLVILGDVNPGAEVRAEGNILVLGRLRGIAHAAIGRDVGFILAHRLEPQQVRIGNLVARPGADDSASDAVELAYVTGKTIVVERYQGRLPSGLAASL